MTEPDERKRGPVSRDPRDIHPELRPDSIGLEAREEVGRHPLSDLQAALRALWPDRPKIYFRHTEGDEDGTVLTDTERGQLTRVAEVIREATADADEAWRQAHELRGELTEAQAEIVRYHRRPPLVSTGDPALDLMVDEAAFEASLQAIYEDTKKAVARAIGLARDIGYRQAEAEHPDEQLDPGAVRAVELEDEQGQRGTLIGPADKIAAIVRPEAIVRDSGSGDCQGGPIG